MEFKLVSPSEIDRVRCVAAYIAALERLAQITSLSKTIIDTLNRAFLHKQREKLCHTGVTPKWSNRIRRKQRLTRLQRRQKRQRK